MDQATPVCARPTKRFPEGRTGTAAGYAAHRVQGEMACEACVAAWTVKCAEQKRNASPDKRERWREGALASGRRARAKRAADAALADACAEGLRGTAAGYEAHIASGQRPCKLCRLSPAEPGAACARPTLRFPAGRAGTTAGYQAHKDAGEAMCDPCVKAWSAKSLDRRRSLSGDELERYRRGNAEATRRRRELYPEEVRAAKHRAIAKNRSAVREAKGKPCTDCGIRYPYYVMEFDHIGVEAKHFNVSSGVTCASYERILAEIAKCEVVCANCHAERTHQRKQAMKGMTADAMD